MQLRIRILNTKLALKSVFAPSPQSYRYGELFYRCHAAALSLSAHNPSTVGAIGIAAGVRSSPLRAQAPSGPLVSRMSRTQNIYVPSHPTQLPFSSLKIFVHSVGVPGG